MIKAIISARRPAAPGLITDSKLTSRHLALLLLQQIARMRCDIAVVRCLLRQTDPIDSGIFEQIFAACDRAAFADVQQGVRDIEE